MNDGSTNPADQGVGQTVRRPAWKLRVALCFLLIISAVASWQIWSFPKDPKIDGRKLSEWLSDLVDDSGAVTGQIGQMEAEKAIRTLGPDAAPYLTYLLDNPEPLRLKLQQFSARMGWQPLERMLRGQERKPPNKTTALVGLALIGTNALQAFAELKSLARDSADPSSYHAFFVLEDACGTSGREEALKILHAAREQGIDRQATLMALVTTELAAMPDAAPLLIEYATNSMPASARFIETLLATNTHRAEVKKNYRIISESI